MSEGLRARWQDPVFREKHVARLRGQQSKACQAAHSARQLYEAAVARGDTMTEAQLHRAVAAYLRLALKPPVIWSTFPSGGGGRVRGAQLKAMGLRAGMPDLLVIAPGPNVVLIELKTDKGKQSLEQRAVETDAFACKCWYVVCRSVEQVQTVLSFCKVPLHASVMGSGTKVAA